ncbi:MAG: 2Fe-2S iron-sulfur cluster-binding protein [Cyanobacteria bacterium P01_F01_bin.13]
MATYSVEIHHQGTIQTIAVDGQQTILAAAQAAGLDLPTSCSAGVCTTCAALLTEGSVSQEDGMGVSQELQDHGYALLCVAYPTSDIKLETEKEDEVYQTQFGQFQG